MSAKNKNTAQRPSARLPYKDMIVEALTALKDPSGSSRRKISSFIMHTYKVNESTVKKRLTPALKHALKKGIIVQSKGIGAAGSFKLPASAVAAKSPVKKGAAKKAAAKKNASAKNTPVKKKPASAKKNASKSPKMSKTNLAKKSPAKKTAVKKSPAKKANTNKAKAKSPAAKKSAKPKK